MVNGMSQSDALVDRVVSIYIVEHGLVDMDTPPPWMLNDAGRLHEYAVTAAMDSVALTHVFSSHTLRSRQTVEGVADAHSLPLIQLPQPGSVLDGQIVTDETPREAAVGPVSEALLNLKAGDTALYGGNSENIFAILNKLGVPVVEGCTSDSVCVPCIDKTCFTVSDLRALWHVTIREHIPGVLGYEKTYLDA
ncbi:Uncharacterised protein [Mycobacteroides abscessus subsp. massiliense]|nr:Uncharacterised protein [Mycobacteroides abscessus subsp. massiliense]SKH92834.1 Uncharacterised protein [Mycobacteroides abscessus subsp. massiliense]SKI13237.1 Uncharacterised protein [Mycobacteroides abscessus subsp. massiliense]SKJ98942.1 Uncharacterised protein [Mycobacteroides abscessus subsp. massiliense]SKK28528.1 Uncharacterised protein [Mycobacteroides abscessus subsp. massiliense]